MATKVVYFSRYGTTRTVAETIRFRLGDAAEIYPLAENPVTVYPEDTVVLVCPVYFGGVNKIVRQFVANNMVALEACDFYLCFCNAIDPVPDSVLTSVHPKVTTIAQQIVSMGTIVRFQRLTWWHRQIYRIKARTDSDLDTLDMQRMDGMISEILAKQTSVQA